MKLILQSILIISLGAVCFARVKPGPPEDNTEPVPLEVCYPNLGCFDTRSPWTSLIRPIPSLPDAPEVVGTRFLLSTRVHPEEYELMSDKDPMLQFSDFKSARRTVFLIHGYTDTGRVDWVVDMRAALLDKEDLNLIVLDWRAGANKSYLKTTANARLAGAELARFISYLSVKAGLNVDSVHLIGHCIGAHIAAYAGDRLGGQIGQITGLDPAEPYFGGTNDMVRLNPSDAKFVTIIHSNGDTALSFGLGIIDNIGHVDIFPNGGKKQPGCKDTLNTLVGSIIDFITFNWNLNGSIFKYTCSHQRAHQIYIESLTSDCAFVAHKCNNHDEYNSGSCLTSCNREGTCTVVGYDSEKYQQGASGKYFLNTGNGVDGAPLCRKVSRFDAPVGLSQKNANGRVTIAFRNSDGSISTPITMFSGNILGGSIINKWFEADAKLLPSHGSNTPIILKYVRTGLMPILEPKELQLDSINLYITNKDLGLDIVRYGGVTLNAGQDHILLPQ